MKDETPSFTALSVAYNVLILGQTGYSLLPPGIVPLQTALLEAIELPWKDYWFLWVLRSCFGPFYCRFYRWFLGQLCTNSLESIGFRKFYMDQQVRDFLETNKDKKNPQVLILGAGYDTLSLRLARDYPNCKFWEMDHPATGNFKNKIWASKEIVSNGPLRIIGEKPDNLFHATVDLTQQDALVETLKAQNSNYDTTKPTIVIIEGLSMYLTKPQVTCILEEVHKVVGPGSVATCDILTTKLVGGKKHADVGFATPLVELYLKLKGEPWLVGLDVPVLKEFVDEHEEWSFDSEIQSFGPLNFATVRIKSRSK